MSFNDEDDALAARFEAAALKKYSGTEEYDVDDEDDVFAQQIEPEDAEVKHHKSQVKLLTQKLAEAEKLRTRAVQDKLPAAKIAKVSSIINKLTMQISEHQDWLANNNNPGDAKLQQLVAALEDMQTQVAELERKIEDTKSLIRVIDPSYFADTDPVAQLEAAMRADEDEQESLAQLMDKRRRECAAMGEYHGKNTVDINQRAAVKFELKF